jgi:hypothetical protein
VCLNNTVPRFSQRFPTLLSQFILDAQEKAGVLVVAHVAYEISDVGAMQVARLARFILQTATLLKRHSLALCLLM